MSEIQQSTLSIKGSISAAGSLSGVLNASIRSKNKSYEGDYTITPKAHDNQELETKNKIMEENLVVLKVPYWETSNLSDGLTVYIAQEVN